MISSGQLSGHESAPHGLEPYTTTGILVKDRDGNEVVTVANHVFPPGEETVYHPDRNGIVIGEIKRRIDEIDIELVQLRPRVAFENKNFQSSSQLIQVEFTQVITPEDELCFGDVSLITIRVRNPSGFLSTGDGMDSFRRYTRGRVLWVSNLG